MSVPVSEFEPFLAMSAPDAPSDILQHVTREAVVRFMRRTRVAEDDYELETQCGVPDYYLDMPDCRELVAIESVDPAHGTWGFVPGFGFNIGAWDWLKDGRHPVVRFGFTPQEDKCYNVRYTWAINRDGCEIPDFIYEEWEEAIKHGALAELLMMPAQEWTRPKIAVQHEKQYQEAVATAKARKWHNYTEGPLQITAPSFTEPPVRRRRRW